MRARANCGWVGLDCKINACVEGCGFQGYITQKLPAAWRIEDQNEMTLLLVALVCLFTGTAYSLDNGKLPLT